MATQESPTARLEATDFASLREALYEEEKMPVFRTPTDWMLEILTPLLIFVMVCAVGFFLLDVRYVYTGVHDLTLRMVLFFFTLGIVALNRMVACEDTAKSFAYFIALAIAITLYTLSLGIATSLARDFMGGHPAVAVGFNLSVMAFFWWMVNRLTYECCIDENLQSGDVGLMTGTLRQWKARLGKRDKAATPSGYTEAHQALEDAYLPTNILDAYDPTDPDAFKQAAPESDAPTGKPRSNRPSKRHPGISVFYFSIPVMLIFTLGLRVTQHGGEAFLRRGDLFLLTYTAAALILLMLTSLGGLRAYLRSRQRFMPAGIGWFWIGLGLVMVGYVLLFALHLPRPELPPMAAVDRHVADPLFGDPEFTPLAAPETRAPSPFLERLQQAALVVLGLFLVIGIPRGLAALLRTLRKLRRQRNSMLQRFLTGCEQFFLRITRWPRLPRPKSKVRVQRDIATCTNYRNPFEDSPEPAMPIRDQIHHAYAALCALAYDLGVPPAKSDTPLEFLAQFPETLASIEEEARDLTQLYLIAAYTDQPLEPQLLRSRLQKFWIGYNRLRNRVLR